MKLLCIIGVCLTVGETAPRLPTISKLPQIVPYTQAQKAAINAERPRVKACCPNTDKAMEHYGKLRSKIEATKALEAGR